MRHLHVTVIQIITVTRCSQQNQNVDQLETFPTDNTYCRSLLSSCSTPSRNSWTQQHSRLLSSKLLRLTKRAAFITSNFSVAFIFFITEKRQTNFQYPLYTAPIWFAYIFPIEKRKRWISFIGILMSKLQNNQISKKKNLQNSDWLF